MVLSFKNQFVDKILDGSKIHTIREDKGNRWRAGMEIHFATGARTKAYKQFHYRLCTGVQRIKIMNDGHRGRKVFVFDTLLSSFLEAENEQFLIERIAKNDGFDSIEDFWAFFNKPLFEGKIIHWIDFKY